MTTIPLSADREVTALLPAPRTALAPVTARRIARALVVYALVWVVGLLLVLADAGHRWEATGLGLAVPGGGFLAGGHTVLAVLAFVAFLLAVFVWWAFGIVLAPPLVWLGTAGLGGLAADTDRGWARIAALLAVPVAVLGFYVLHRVRHASQARTGLARNARLREVPFVVTGAPELGTRLPVTEHSAEDLAHLRYVLDLTLQPLDRFDGFNKLDQFREAATRYQLNALGYAMAMSQFTRTPAFTGYLAEAQRNAITKMLDPRVWGYWAIENAWGNLRLGRDPVQNNDNIMLTGYYGTQLGMYETLNDDRFSAPGALTFRRKTRGGAEQAYVHDFGSVTASLHRNFGACAFTLFPCEPNWIYSVCNAFGINALVVHDRLHGTGYMDADRESLRRGFEEEFLRPDGKVIGVRTKLLGLSWNLWAGAMVQVNTVYWLHASFPEIAHRTWWLLRQKELRLVDGRAVLPAVISSRLDPGNYILGRDTFAQCAVLMAARELGDEEYAQAAQRALDAKEPVEANGALRHRGASVWTNCYAALGRFGRYSALRDLLAFGAPEQWRTGPVLAQAGYPDVLVARAVTDGHALDLVLRPGGGPVRTTLAIERLVPGREYAVTGAAESTVTADASGRALLTVDLGDRHEVRVH